MTSEYALCHTMVVSTTALFPLLIPLSLLASAVAGVASGATSVGKAPSSTTSSISASSHPPSAAPPLPQHLTPETRLGGLLNLAFGQAGGEQQWEAEGERRRRRQDHNYSNQPSSGVRVSSSSRDYFITSEEESNRTSTHIQSRLARAIRQPEHRKRRHTHRHRRHDYQAKTFLQEVEEEEEGTHAVEKRESFIRKERRKRKRRRRRWRRNNPRPTSQTRFLCGEHRFQSKSFAKVPSSWLEKGGTSPSSSSSSSPLELQHPLLNVTAGLVPGVKYKVSFSPLSSWSSLPVGYDLKLRIRHHPGTFSVSSETPSSSLRVCPGKPGVVVGRIWHSNKSSLPDLHLLLDDKEDGGQTSASQVSLELFLLPLSSSNVGHHHRYHRQQRPRHRQQLIEEAEDGGGQNHGGGSSTTDTRPQPYTTYLEAAVLTKCHLRLKEPPPSWVNVSDIAPPRSKLSSDLGIPTCQLSLPVNTNNDDITNIVIKAVVILGNNSDGAKHCANELQDSVRVQLIGGSSKGVRQIAIQETEEGKECAGSVDFTVSLEGSASSSVVVSVARHSSTLVSLSVLPWRLRPTRADFVSNLVREVSDKGLEGQVILRDHDYTGSLSPVTWLHAPVGYFVEIRLLGAGTRKMSVTKVKSSLSQKAGICACEYNVTDGSKVILQTAMVYQQDSHKPKQCQELTLSGESSVILLKSNLVRLSSPFNAKIAYRGRREEGRACEGGGTLVKKHNRDGYYCLSFLKEEMDKSCLKGGLTSKEDLDAVQDFLMKSPVVYKTENTRVSVPLSVKLYQNLYPDTATLWSLWTSELATLPVCLENLGEQGSFSVTPQDCLAKHGVTGHYRICVPDYVTWNATESSSINATSIQVALTASRDEALLHSPGFGKDRQYPPNTKIAYHINSPPGFVIMIVVDKMDLEAGYAGLRKGVFCLFDRLEISWINKSVVLCGNWPESSLPGPFLLDSQEAMLEFTADDTAQGAGFRIKVRLAKQRTEETPGSSSVELQTLTNESEALETDTEQEDANGVSGWLAIPEESDGSDNRKYAHNMDRRFRIKSPPGTRVRIQFKKFDVEGSPDCLLDYMEVSSTPFLSSPSPTTSGEGNFTSPSSSSFSTVEPTAKKWCGSFGEEEEALQRLNFESPSNELYLRFVSDATVSAGGFVAEWQAFREVNSCSNRTVRALNRGVVSMPEETDPSGVAVKYVGDALLCSVAIVAPVDHRIVASLHPDERGCGNKTDTTLDAYPLVGFEDEGSVSLCQSDAEVISGGTQLVVRIKATRQQALFQPIKIQYKAESFQFEHVGPPVYLSESEMPSATVSNTNHPLSSPPNLVMRRSVATHSGDNVRMAVRANSSGVRECEGKPYLQVDDPYKSGPRSSWRFCDLLLDSHETDNHLQDDGVVYLQSYLGILHLTEVTGPDGSGGRLKYHIRVTAVKDHDTNLKVIQLTHGSHSNLSPGKSSSSSSPVVAVVPYHGHTTAGNGQHGNDGEQGGSHLGQVCDNNLCFNGGHCDPIGRSQDCVCKGHFIGRHCLQTTCDLNPCRNGGVCQLTSDSHRCSCRPGFDGASCELRLRPCHRRPDPCSGHGVCIERDDSERGEAAEEEIRKKRIRMHGEGKRTGVDMVEGAVMWLEGGYRCQCHLWWTGLHCTEPMKNIPFKPLSERMLEEPFWLGLITVIAVLIIIAIAYFLKKHLSESFEKLFVDDLEKGKVVERSCSGYYQCTPQVSIASDANDITALIASTGGTMERERRSSSFDISPSAAARSLLSKLSIRKPSILSISSNASSPGGIGGNGGGNGGGNEQKFSSSQEDLVLRRSPSPNKKKQFLSPRDEEERRKILKMLVTPGSGGSGGSTGSQDHGRGGGSTGYQSRADRRSNSAANFESLIIKAARSAEALNNSSSNTLLSPSPSGASNFFRKESSLSLQIPNLISPSAIANKKVTFSQVVDQMACSMSDSSSLSDLSCAEDFKQSVSASLAPNSGQQHSKHYHHGGRRARKLFRSSGRHKRKYGLASVPPPGVYSLGGGNSGSEEVFESSLESIESSAGATQARSHLSALTPYRTTEGNTITKHLQKNASADSLLSMMKNLSPSSNSVSLKAHPASTPSSPQLSDNGSSGFATPLTTPETPSMGPFFGSPLRRSGSGGSSESSVNAVGSVSTQIKVEVHDHPDDSGSDSSPGINSGASNTAANSNNAGLTLEVPGFHYGKCLSPIKELPSPLPTPSGSPLPSRASPSPSQDSTSSSNSASTTSSRRNSFLRFRKKSAPSSKELERSIEEGTKMEQSHMEELRSQFSPKHQSSEEVPCDDTIKYTRRCSYAGDSILFQETTFEVPQLTNMQQTSQQTQHAKHEKIFKRTQSAFTAIRRPPLIPSITLTMPDCHEETSIKPPLSPRSPSRAPRFSSTTGRSISDVSESQLPTNIVIPQVFVSFDEECEEEEESVTKSANGSPRSNEPPQICTTSPSPCTSPSSSSKSFLSKWRPPPLYIPNSNFKNFFGSSKNESSSDTKSMPPLTTTNEIELQEMKRTGSPTATVGHKKNKERGGGGNGGFAIPAVAVTASTPKSSPETPKRPLVKQKSLEVEEEIPASPRVRSKMKDAQMETTPTVCKDAGIQVEEEDLFGHLATSPKTKVGSPKLLLAPETFDSTPRSRSQSVELPEMRVAHFIQIHQQQQKQKQHIVRMATCDESKTNKASENVLPKPVTPLTARRGSRDDRLALLLRQRSLAGAAACTNSTLAPQKSTHMSTADSTKTSEDSWKGIRHGSPPLKKDPPMMMQPPSFHIQHQGGGKLVSSSGGGAANVMRNLRSYDKPQSLDLPGIAPAIMITPIEGSGSSEQMESDGDSPVIKVTTANVASGMHYLSPFTIATTNCGSRTTSESNLSSSGYSSMASPGPSRSGSSNPLCASESEDTSSTPTSSSGFFVTSAIPMASSSVVAGNNIPQVVFIRRPSPLLKSPSVDSESSDPNTLPPTMVTFPIKGVGGVGVGGIMANRRGNAMRKLHERGGSLLIAYRTDSETTDEQCIPESVSEFNDSAMDSTEDIEDEELKEEKEEPELVKIVGESESTSARGKSVEVKSADTAVNVEPATTPMICLEVRDSSTESDKTTLSINTVLDHTSGNGRGTGTDSLPSTPGIVSQASLSLPEIVVEEPRTPPATSPLASPNEVNKSAMVNSRRSSQEEAAVRPASPKHFMPKASSLPPLSNSNTKRSSLEYDQLSSPMSPLSASSSRSESPLSDRYCTVPETTSTGSTLSLQAGLSSARQAESDGVMEYHKSTPAPPTPSSPAPNTKRRRQQWRKRRKKSEKDSTDRNRRDDSSVSEGVFVVTRGKSLADGERSSSSGKTSVELPAGMDMAECCSPRKTVVRRRLRRLRYSASGSLGDNGSSSNGGRGCSGGRSHGSRSHHHKHHRCGWHTSSSLDFFSPQHKFFSGRSGRKAISSSSSNESICSTFSCDPSSCSTVFSPSPSPLSSSFRSHSSAIRSCGSCSHLLLLQTGNNNSGDNSDRRNFSAATSPTTEQKPLPSSSPVSTKNAASSSEDGKREAQDPKGNMDDESGSSSTCCLHHSSLLHTTASLLPTQQQQQQQQQHAFFCINTSSSSSSSSTSKTGSPLGSASAALLPIPVKLRQQQQRQQRTKLRRDKRSSRDDCANPTCDSKARVSSADRSGKGSSS